MKGSQAFKAKKVETLNKVQSDPFTLESGKKVKRVTRRIEQRMERPSRGPATQGDSAREEPGPWATGPSKLRLAGGREKNCTLKARDV